LINVKKRKKWIMESLGESLRMLFMFNRIPRRYAFICVLIIILSVATKSLASGRWVDYAADSFAGGKGTREEPYLISSAEMLARLAVLVNEGRMDIDSVGFNEKNYLINTDIDLGEHEWVPIGYSEDGVRPFSGYLDGGGYSISNMRINSFMEKISVGLFMSVKNDRDFAERGIANLNIAGMEISRIFGGGGLAGENHSILENCSVTGYIEGGGGGAYVGGLVGINYGTIKKCATSAVVKVVVGEMDSTGGLVGYNAPRGIVEGCFTNSNVMNMVTLGRGGGLIGTNYGIVMDSIADAGIKVETKIEGIGGFAGLLIGENKGVIENNGISGDVSLVKRGDIDVADQLIGKGIGHHEISLLKICGGPLFVLFLAIASIFILRFRYARSRRRGGWVCLTRQSRQRIG
jgi:hypothetical protein